jgi:hypothetical protein
MATIRQEPASYAFLRSIRHFISGFESNAFELTSAEALSQHTAWLLRRLSVGVRLPPPPNAARLRTPCHRSLISPRAPLYDLPLAAQLIDWYLLLKSRSAASLRLAYRPSSLSSSRLKSPPRKDISLPPFDMQHWLFLIMAIASWVVFHYSISIIEIDTKFDWYNTFIFH